MIGLLDELAPARASGRPFGLTSICSAHPEVIRAAAKHALDKGFVLLIEATCNQVNQFGGYTGMAPADFVDQVRGIVAKAGLPNGRLILGGDHLGPNPWKNEPQGSAMAKAEMMVAAYVKAGFRKLHLDTSMGCAGEPIALDDTQTALRAARLARVAEDTARGIDGDLPRYIIGTEVPVPGGANHTLDSVTPTSADAAMQTIAIHRKIFGKANLEAALERVIAVVVQPGVEFGNDNVIAYNPSAAAGLTKVLQSEPQLVFEAHSTDYQDRPALRQLVIDGFPILKVGPGLTFVLREVLYGLDMIASEMIEGYGERPLQKALEKVMLSRPRDWQSHYHGAPIEQKIQRHYSYSDRVRYYWGTPDTARRVDHLLSAMETVTIPETLRRQYLAFLPPGKIVQNDPKAILLGAVEQVLDDYHWASTGGASVYSLAQAPSAG